MALKAVSLVRFVGPRLLWSRLAYCSCSGSLAEFESATRMLKNNLQPDRLAGFLDSTKDLNLALRIFRWASHQRAFVHTVDTYACMISKIAVAGDHDEMDGLLKEMVKLGVPGSEKILNGLVHYLSKKNQFDEALLVVRHASSGSIKLSVSSCNCLLCGLVKEGRGLRPFMRAYMEIVKAGVLPDVDTLNWLIEVLSEAGNLDLALIQFDRMSKKRCTPNCRTFKILIVSLCSLGRVDESVGLFDKMLQMRCIPDSCFYAQVLPLFCKFNKYKEASKLHQMMKEDSIRLDPHLYSELIRCLCRNQLLDDAAKTFEEMIASGHSPMTGTYMDVVHCYCTSSQFLKAMSFLEENDVAETEPYNVLLRTLCETGKLQDSVSYLEKLHNRGLVDCHSWNIIIAQFCNKGHIKRALELIGRLTVSSFAVDENTYSSVVSCYCRLGLYKNGLDLFKRVSVSNLSLNSESFSQLVDGLCHMKRIQEAAKVFIYHCKRGCSLSSESLDLLIQGNCTAGMIHEAIKIRLLAVCTGTSCMLSTYNEIIQALVHLKKEKDILLLFAQMLMEGCPMNKNAYDYLLCCFLFKERIVEATVLFNRMVSSGFVPDQETFERLVLDMSLHSLLNRVSESLLKVLTVDGMMSPRISNIIIYGLIKEGFKSEACKFLDQMLDKGWVPDSRTHWVLIGEEAREVVEIYQAVDDDNVSNILMEGLD